MLEITENYWNYYFWHRQSGCFLFLTGKAAFGRGFSAGSPEPDLIVTLPQLVRWWIQMLCDTELHVALALYPRRLQCLEIQNKQCVWQNVHWLIFMVIYKEESARLSPVVSSFKIFKGPQRQILMLCLIWNACRCRRTCHNRLESGIFFFLTQASGLCLMQLLKARERARLTQRQ